MKKSFIFKLCLLCMFLLLYVDVYAAANHPYSNSLWDQCIDDGTCVALCGYTNSVQPYPSTNPSYIEKYSAYIHYDLEDNNFYITWYTQETDVSFAKNQKIISHKYIFMESDVLQNLTQNGACPQNAYIDTHNVSEVCFDNDGKYCAETVSDTGFWKTTVFLGDSELLYNYETHITSYFSNFILSDIDCADFDINNMASKVLKDFNTNFLHGYNTPDFIINSSAYKNRESLMSTASQNYKTTCKEEISNNTSLTEEEKAEELEKLEYTEEELTEKVEKGLQQGASGIIPGTNVSDDPGCHGLLGAEMTKVVNNIFSFIQYLAPVLVIVFTILDLIKAAASGDQEQMKKSAQKFIKRVICAILLFFTPLLCKMLFSISGLTVPETCIK